MTSVGRRDRGDERADADPVEVHPERRHEHAVARPVDERSRGQRAADEHGPDAEKPPQSHGPDIGAAALVLKAQRGVRHLEGV